MAFHTYESSSIISYSTIIYLFYYNVNKV